MRHLIGRSILVIYGAFLFSHHVVAQKKLLIIGSSTSTCFFGPSSFDSCYVTRLQKYYSDNGIQLTVDNRAVAGDNCYHGAPLNYPIPPGRNSPRSFNNITEGLAGNPDLVLVNYPSNGYDEFSVDETVSCLRAIKQAANNAGKECYITTTQPRNDPESFRTPATRAKMLELKQRIISEFGNYAINFWDGLVNTADLSILNEYNADGIHLNNAGHRILFNRVLERNILHQNTGNPVGTRGLNYRYYEGQWLALPNFNTLASVKSGTSANIDLSARNGEEHFGLLWEGFINIPTAGVYTFEVVSDDGSKMYFNNTYSANATALVNNDGLHEQQSSAASVNVNAAGAYPVAFAYFQRGGGHTMNVYWSGPGINRQLVPDDVFTRMPPASNTGGLNFRYYEGEWLALPDFNALTPVKTGSSANVDLSPRNSSENFGFIWEGNITVPTAGVYTFEVVSDDGSKMYFNTAYSAGATALVNNDGLHEQQSSAASLNIGAGTYPVVFTYLQRGGGRTMQVYWTGPNFSRQLIPNEAFSGAVVQPPATGSLKYRYYEGQWTAVPDFNAMTPLKSGASPNLDLSVSSSNENFGIIWEGFIRIPQAGTYNFEIASDDGSNLYFNNTYSAGTTPLVNNDGLHEEQYISRDIYVNAPGNYPIAFAYFQRGGGKTLKAFWSGPGFPRQPIPDAAFTSSSTRTNAAANSNALATVPELKTINIYPNPFKQKLRISYFNDNSQQPVLAGLYDLAGKLVYAKDFKNLPTGNNTLLLDLGQYRKLTAGIYFIKLQVNNQVVKTFKVVKSVD